MTINSNKFRTRAGLLVITLSTGLLSACSSSDDSLADAGSSVNPNNTATTVVDIKDAIFDARSADCADYANSYEAAVLDIQRSSPFDLNVVMTSSTTSCTLASNNIPNHDFNDATANFATNVAEVSQSFTIPRLPTAAAATTALTQRTYNAIMLNGVPLDIKSAGCYSPDSPMADADGNVAIGCTDNDAWLLDPLGTTSRFGADSHNAHTQPNGSYHYHGNPMAMFDGNPGPDGSPVIGFAADGLPVYGSYFLDQDTGSVRKALSSYELKTGSRPTDASSPGGNYDGEYIDDYEYSADSGDLDECNGMTVNGQYGYYVTDTYPWVIGCHKGTPDASFSKGGGPL